MLYKSQQNVTHSRIINLDDRLTKEEIQLAVFRYLRPVLRAPDISASIKPNEQINEEKQLKLEL